MSPALALRTNLIAVDFGLISDLLCYSLQRPISTTTSIQPHQGSIQPHQGSIQPHQGSIHPLSHQGFNQPSRFHSAIRFQSTFQPSRFQSTFQVSINLPTFQPSRFQSTFQPSRLQSTIKSTLTHIKPTRLHAYNLLNYLP